MKIGVPKEIKPQENRIGLTPESVKILISEGHKVIVENNGGFEAGFENEQYINAGAKIANTAADIFNDAEIIVKVISCSICNLSTCINVLFILKARFKTTVVFNNNFVTL
jgi:alanine dehydrogenase